MRPPFFGQGSAAEGGPPESPKPFKYRRFRRPVPVKKHARSSLDGRRRIYRLPPLPPTPELLALHQTSMDVHRMLSVHKAPAAGPTSNLYGCWNYGFSDIGCFPSPFSNEFAFRIDFDSCIDVEFGTDCWVEFV